MNIIRARWYLGIISGWGICVVIIHGYCLGTKRVSKGTSKQRRRNSRDAGSNEGIGWSGGAGSSEGVGKSEGAGSGDNASRCSDGKQTSGYMNSEWVSTELLVRSSDTILETDKQAQWKWWKRFFILYYQVHIDGLYSYTLKHQTNSRTFCCYVEP